MIKSFSKSYRKGSIKILGVRNMTIKLTLTLLAMTSLGCSNGSQFGENRNLKSGGEVSSENYDDQSNFAEVPSAVAGDYIFWNATTKYSG